MQMEEVRAVLHAIFRDLLKRLDKAELRDAARVRQGKTCQLFHKSDFVSANERALLIVWITDDSSTDIDLFSTVQPQPAILYLLGMIFIFLLIHDLCQTTRRSILSDQRWRDKTLGAWIDFNP
ncbi:hypothetical protein [Rhizobium sp. LjRoot258]|uniref:hypothetical protein n=1 Tax=Rhizobium sp. LjRoot258 TaxID=3342299 RepID=UPI003ECEB396